MAEVHGNRTHQPHGPKEAVFPEGGAESGALFGDDERLRVLLEAWPELPESVKDAIRALVLRSPGEAEWRWLGVRGLGILLPYFSFKPEMRHLATENRVFYLNQPPAVRSLLIDES
jgi:hypothetical protein